MSTKNNNNWNIYCGNCGKIGHIYRRCTEPITSLGVILFQIVNNKIKYLLIQRRDTLGFVEFMRGKYNLENLKYISNILEIMTIEERDKILSNDFDTLWNNLWMNMNSKQYLNEYDSSKKKFNDLKRGFKVQDEFINLKILNDRVLYIYDGPEWGFPKGRRNLKESNIDCARREFEEETGLKPNDYELIMNIDPLEEIFLGTNNIRYKHIYYVAKTNKDILPVINLDNYNQVTEISNIQWFTYEKAQSNLRSYNKEKKKVLEKLNSLLISKKVL